jgi:hypothetical protein
MALVEVHWAHRVQSDDAGISEAYLPKNQLKKTAIRLLADLQVS